VSRAEATLLTRVHSLRQLLLEPRGNGHERAPVEDKPVRSPRRAVPGARRGRLWEMRVGAVAILGRGETAVVLVRAAADVTNRRRDELPAGAATPAPINSHGIVTVTVKACRNVLLQRVLAHDRRVSVVEHVVEHGMTVAPGGLAVATVGKVFELVAIGAIILNGRELHDEYGDTVQCSPLRLACRCVQSQTWINIQEGLIVKLVIRHFCRCVRDVRVEMQRGWCCREGTTGA
jgi:hypothetical protein